MDDIRAYYKAIRSGSITAGKWIKKLYEKIVNGIESGEYILDQKKADNAIRFIEHFMHHNKGPLAPQRLTLELWQRAMISVIFGIVDEYGIRIFREIFIVIGRKNGKTLLAAAIMAYAAFAEPEFGKEIYCIAPKLDQSDLVYSAFRFSVDAEPSLARITKPRKNDLYIERSNTTIKRIAFSEKKSDGYNPYLTVADEMASWPAARGLKQYEAIASGTTARPQPLTLSISSAGYVDEGPYDELFKRGTAFLNGDSREKRLLPFLYVIDDMRKWDDITELHKSLPGLGVSIKTDTILDEIDVAYSSLSKKAEFLAKYCNVKQNSSQAWLPEIAVQKARGEALRLEDFRDTYAVCGVDLSRTTDLTAAVCVIERGGEFYVFAHFWLPAEKIAEATARDGLPYQIYIERGILTASGDNIVDYHDCEAWLKSLVTDYQIFGLMVGYDRYCAQYLVKNLEAFGYHTDDVFQGYNMTPAIRTVEGLMKDGRVHIGDNDLLAVHLLDSAVKAESDSERMKLVKLRKNGHIDGTAALLDAFIVRDKWAGEIGEQLRNEG